MTISVQKSIYAPKSKDDGLRVLVMRFWPRGIRKDRVDVWYENLGTSKELIKAWKTHKVTWEEFRKEYVASLKLAETGELIGELARISRRQNITLLCSCRDPELCHRSLLKDEIQKTLNA